MAFTYQPSDPSGRLSQGELLRNVDEPLLEVGSGTTFTKVPHDKVLVLTPDCDLVADFQYRHPDNETRQKEGFINSRESNLLKHVLLCDLYEESEARPAIAGSIWSRVPKNQMDRYHYIPSGTRASPASGEHPDWYLDFKRVFSLPPEWLYERIRDADISRQGVVPSPWINSVTHRLFSFQARVCLPDPEDDRQLMQQPELLK